MGYCPFAQDENLVGHFVEKDFGHWFEFSKNDEEYLFANYPHKVWVGGINTDQSYRYALVKKTVAYVVVDEDDYGLPVVEKWNIKKHNEFNKIAY